MFTLKKDGSIEDKNGKVMFYSVNRFISEICEGNCCFICGVEPSKAEFNDEHILPKWILRKYKLFARKIGLPNLSDFRYDRYVVPCCKECNKLMNEEIEHPIKKLLNKGYNEISKYLKSNGPWLFFIWLNLIYLKTHLKDKNLTQNFQSVEDSKKISDYYTWEELHHIHCVARSFFTKVNIDYKVMGSFEALPAKVTEHFENYDYADMYYARTILLRLGDTAFISVLNDSCGAMNLIMHIIEKITDYLSPIQIRELFGRLAFANIYLKERPKFFSDIDIQNEKIKISAYSPSKASICDYDSKEFGALLHFCCSGMFPSIKTKEHYDMLENLRQGRYTFILDKNEKFINNSMDLME